MRVQTKLMVGALALTLGSAAIAHGSGRDELGAIAQSSGLRPQEVQMLLSRNPTAYTTWYGGYDVSARKLKRAVREGRVQLRRSVDGAMVSFAQWQTLPTRTIALVAPAQVRHTRLLAISQ